MQIVLWVFVSIKMPGRSASPIFCGMLGLQNALVHCRDCNNRDWESVFIIRLMPSVASETLLSF